MLVSVAPAAADASAAVTRLQASTDAIRLGDGLLELLLLLEPPQAEIAHIATKTAS